MSDGMRKELVYLSSHATNRYFIPNWGNNLLRNCCFSLAKIVFFYLPHKRLFRKKIEKRITAIRLAGRWKEKTGR